MVHFHKIAFYTEVIWPISHLPTNAYSSQNQPGNFDKILLVKAFEGKMFNRTLPTTVLQTFHEIIYNPKIVVI